MSHQCSNLFRHLASLVVVAVAATISLATLFGSAGDSSFNRNPAKFKCESAPPITHSYRVESLVRNAVTREPLHRANVSVIVTFYSTEKTGVTDVFGDEICKTKVEFAKEFKGVTNQAGVAVLNFESVTWDSKKDKLTFSVGVTKDGWSFDARQHTRFYSNSGDSNMSSTFNLSFEEWKYE